MKKFNFSKGLVIGLLTLALCLTCFGVAKVSADETPAVTVKVTVTDEAHGGKVSTYTWSIDKIEDATQVQVISPLSVLTNAKLDGDSTKTLGASGYYGNIAAGFTTINGTAAAEFVSADAEAYTYNAVGTTIQVLKRDTAGEALTFNIGFTSNNEEYGTALVEAEPTTTPTPTPTPTGVVNFIVHVQCADTDVAGDYELESTLSAKDDSTTLADILGAAKKGDVKLEDAAAWILDTNTDKSKDFLKDDEYLSFTATDGTIKVKKALTADREVEIYVAPAKLNVSFTVTDGGKDYTSIFSVENGAKTKAKISYVDIAAGLETKVGNETVALEGKVVTKVGETAQSGKYASSAYEVANNVIGYADFDPVEIEVEDAFDASTGYDPATDSIVFSSPVELTVYWADVKKAAGAQLKGSALKSLDLKKVVKDDVTTYVGSIALNDKSAGVKVGENKSTYIYASFTAPADEKAKAKYSPNFVVDATPYKKIAVTFAYAQADKDNAAPAIASVTTIDNNKKTVLYSGAAPAERPADDTNNYLDDIIDGLQFSVDGTTWYSITGNVDPKTDKPANNLDLGTLYTYVNSGSKTTLYFRIKGAAATPEEGKEGEEGYQAAKNAYRATKVVKATIAAAKEAKAVKINVATGTIALKNGYDYATTDPAEKGKNEPSIEAATTILPFNKAGKAKGKNAQNEEVATYTIATSAYVPVKKVTDNDQMFTNIKVKSVLIEDIADTSADMYIWIRKSATVSKPAEKWVCITLGKVTDAPVITKTKAGYFSAQDPADTKGVIATPEIKNASSDKNSGAYEYLIIDAADYAEGVFSVDFTSAKWTTLNDKGLTVGKSKSKYAKTVGAKAKTAVLKEGSIILVRRAGDKSSNILASDFEMTMVVKQDLEVEVEKADGTKEKVTKSLYVWTEYKAQ